MLYLKTNEALSLRFGEVTTTTAPDWHVFYSEPTTKQSRDEITLVDSFEAARGTKAAAITAAETILSGPSATLSDANNGSGANAKRYKCRVIIANLDTIAHTCFLSTLVGSAHKYVVPGTSIPAGGTLTVADDGTVNVSGTPITSVTAGAALTGGGSSGAVTLDVAVDNSTIEVSSDALRVKDAGITDAKLANMGARSVKGRSANSSGAPADISFASSAGKFLGDRGSVLGAFYPTQVLTKTDVNYTLVTDDYGSLVLMNPTTSRTATLPAPATVGQGWWCMVRKTNASTSVTVSIARNGSETIDGRSASDVLTAQYSYAIYMTDGTNWFVMGAWDYIETKQTTDASFPAATTAWGDGLTLTLQPGLWMIDINLYATLNGGTMSSLAFGRGTASGTASTGFAAGDTGSFILPPTASDTGSSIPGIVDEITAASTPRYLKLNATFTGTPKWRGRISASRKR